MVHILNKLYVCVVGVVMMGFTSVGLHAEIGRNAAALAGRGIVLSSGCCGLLYKFRSMG